MSSALLEATVIHAFRNVNVPPALISWKSIQVYGFYIYISNLPYISLQLESPAFMGSL